MATMLLTSSDLIYCMSIKHIYANSYVWSAYNCAYLFIIPCMALHHPIYLHLFSTLIQLSIYMVCDPDHVHNWLFLVIGQSLLNEPSLLQALYQRIDCLNILDHLHRFVSVARDSRNICLILLSLNFVKCIWRGATSLVRYINAQFVLYCNN